MTVPLSCSPLGNVYLLEVAEDEAARVQVHAAETSRGRGALKSAVLKSVFMAL